MKEVETEVETEVEAASDGDGTWTGIGITGAALAFAMIRGGTWGMICTTALGVFLVLITLFCDVIVLALVNLLTTLLDESL